jgi:adenine-specific DNA methylase
VSLEKHFDAVFATSLALREKQIQQNYRPVIGVHKWFARRPGTIFRNLLLAEFNGSEPLETNYWRAHEFHGVIADPFMGGGTPIYEANRLGFSVVGTDINPMAFWVVRQSLSELDLNAFQSVAESAAADVERVVGSLYRTKCAECGNPAEVKYFLWVKTEVCPHCNTTHDLFPGYLLAEAERHPRHVVVCGSCGALNEYERQPTVDHPQPCSHCRAAVHVEGPTHRQRIACRKCGIDFAYPQRDLLPHPPEHRLWAMEYHCARCKPRHEGRFFKVPDAADLARVTRAKTLLKANSDLPIPQEKIPPGDETARLLRWGYRSYREMFNERQLLGLGLLLRRIREVESREVRYALLTVFSDFLRYQNMLCRYDTYALKCQDIFSVHGFPVGLVQCENNLLGIPKVGSGSFRHFVEKYLRAKNYCIAPFETEFRGKQKRIVPVPGEHIGADLVTKFPGGDKRQAWIQAAPAERAKLPASSLAGVFTDPPYFDNVQYAELMDFCFAWLRLGLKDEFREFAPSTTRNGQELTGNTTMGRGLEHFTGGLSQVFCHYAAALKPGAPFVFTYHHNNPEVYLPLVVAILDAGLTCTAALPAAAEMNASLHIAGTVSSSLDSVFVCRREGTQPMTGEIRSLLDHDLALMRKAGVKLRDGDVRCLAAGHIARRAVLRLHPSWDGTLPLQKRMVVAAACLRDIIAETDVESLVTELRPAAKWQHAAKEPTIAATI